MLRGTTWAWDGDGTEQREYLSEIADCGFETLDFQNTAFVSKGIFLLEKKDYENELTKAKKTAGEYGLNIWQTHGPWDVPMPETTPEGTVKRLFQMEKSLYGAAVLGAKYMAIHPVMPYGFHGEEPEKTIEMNLDFYTILERKAREYGVIICLENMPFKKFVLSTPISVLDVVKKIDSPFVKMTLDTGHSIDLGVTPADAVKQIGKEYLSALHVHDNDGDNDNHWLVYEGGADWHGFMNSLAEIGFEGSVSFEGSFLPSQNRYSTMKERQVAMDRLFGEIDK